MSVNSADPGNPVDVVLVKGGRTKIRYAAELLSDDGTRIAVRAPWAGDGVRDFGFVRFEPATSSPSTTGGTAGTRSRRSGTGRAR